jgi:hypothetical protein
MWMFYITANEYSKPPFNSYHIVIVLLNTEDTKNAPYNQIFFSEIFPLVGLYIFFLTRVKVNQNMLVYPCPPPHKKVFHSSIEPKPYRVWITPIT